MPVDEIILDLALELTDESEEFANKSNYSEAILKIQQAIDLFKKSGLSIEEQKQALDMLNFKQEEYIEKEKKEGIIQKNHDKIEQNKLVRSPIKEPKKNKQDQNQKKSQIKKNILVEEGLQKLDNAQILLNQGKYESSLKIFSIAIKKLTKAGWKEAQLSNINNIVNKITAFIESQKKKTGENFTPTYLKTKQSNIIDHKSSISSTLKKNQQKQEYKPSFLQFENEQKNILTHVVKKHKLQKSEDKDDYKPTFLQTEQLDYGKIKKNSKAIEQAKVKESQYIPTFAKTTQKNQYIIPNLDSDLDSNKRIKRSTERRKQNFIPTFAKPEKEKVTMEKKELNIKELSKMISAIKTDAINRNKQNFSVKIKVKEKKAHSNEKSNKFNNIEEEIISKNLELPSHILIDKKNQLNSEAGKILTNFQAKINEYSHQHNESYKLLENVQKLEKEGKYNLAIAKLLNLIKAIKSFHGWAAQASVLYAWLLILQEKKRVNYSSKETSLKFDIAPIKKEFNRILSKSLEITKEIAISFDDFYNQELTASQLFEEKFTNQRKNQNKIYKLIDLGKLLILNEKYQDSIEIFNESLLLINSLGWYEISQNIREIIKELISAKDLVDYSLTQEQILADEKDQISSKKLKNSRLKQFEARKNRLQKLNKQKERKKSDELEAFSLISTAEGHLTENNFDKALEVYKKASQILISVGWDSQMSIINKKIEKIQKKKEKFINKNQEIYLEELKGKEKEREFQIKVKSQIDKKQIDLERVKDERERKEPLKKKILIIQEKIDNLIETADNYSSVHQFPQAYSTLLDLEKLLKENDLMAEMHFCKDLKEHLEKQEIRYKQNVIQESKRKQQELQEKIEFEEYLFSEAEKIEEKREEKKKKLEKFHKSKKEQHNFELEAFNLIDQAEKALKEKQFMEAIEMYEKSNLIFKKIGWNIEQKKHIENVKRMQKRYEIKVKNAEKERQKQKKQLKQIEKDEITKKQNVESALNDIHTMLHFSNNKDGKITQNRESREEKLSKRLLDEIKGVKDKEKIIYNKEKILQDEAKEVKKAKEEKDLAEFRKMIREAAKK